MESDTKAELSDAITDYIWYKMLKNTKGMINNVNGDMVLVDEAQNIFNNIYDIIDEVAGEKE